MTSPPPDERLLAYVLGTLPADQRTQLEHELGPKLTHERLATERALTALTLTLAPVTPSPSLRQRLLTATRGMGGCFVDPCSPSGCSTQMVGGKAVFENNNYRISAGDNNEVLIQNKNTGDKQRPVDAIQYGYDQFTDT